MPLLFRVRTAFGCRVENTAFHTVLFDSIIRYGGTIIAVNTKRVARQHIRHLHTRYLHIPGHSRGNQQCAGTSRCAANTVSHRVSTRE